MTIYIYIFSTSIIDLRNVICIANGGLQSIVVMTVYLAQYQDMYLNDTQIEALQVRVGYL